MTKRHTFEATYRGFPVELMVEADGAHPGGVRLTGCYFGNTWPIVISAADAQKIGDKLTAASQEQKLMPPEPAGEG